MCFARGDTNNGYLVKLAAFGEKFSKRYGINLFFRIRSRPINSHVNM
jgi:hypothetical protein